MATGRKRRIRNNPKRANLNIREVENKNNLPYEYEVYLWQAPNDEYEVGNIQHAHDEIAHFVRNNLAGEYQVVRKATDRPWQRGIINVIRLGDESMLMMFMLCHRAAVRKIFKLVESPKTGAF